jgi:hypothetical protein
MLRFRIPARLGTKDMAVATSRVRAVDCAVNFAAPDSLYRRMRGISTDLAPTSQRIAVTSAPLPWPGSLAPLLLKTVLRANAENLMGLKSGFSHNMAKPAKLVLPFPEQCPACAADSGVRLDQIIHGKNLQIAWACDHCGHEWPVVERRTGRPDLRGVPRTDRRAKH